MALSPLPFSLRPAKFLTVFITLCLCFLSWIPAAYASIPIGLKDLVAEECPADAAYAENLTSSGSSQQATCYLIRGTAVNSANKDIVDADIFGRIYDAEDNAVMKNTFRLGGIEYVPVGESPFSFRISVPSVQHAPLRLEKFKASGFATKVRRFQAWDQSIDEGSAAEPLP
jgi:hypothetical protein